MQANNHAVREAACACIGELCEKVSQEAVEPNVPALLAALLVCFRDESWPCRDAAAAGTSALVAAYPTAAAPQLGDLWKLWLEHLGDNVPSVARRRSRRNRQGGSSSARRHSGTL